MQSIFARLRQGSPLPDIVGLHQSSSALLLTRALEDCACSLCCILPTDEQVEILSQDLGFFSSAPVLIYPSIEIPPYTPLAADPHTLCSRISTLYQMGELRQPALILCSVEAALRRIIPPAALHRHCELVMTGEEVAREQLIAALSEAGYQVVDMVRQEGDMALRGGIIDIFPPAWRPGIQGPLRLDFFGDLLESIRIFDPLTQRSREELEEAILLPATDLLFPPKKEQARMLAEFDALAENSPAPTTEWRAQRERLNARQRFPGMESLLPLLLQKEQHPAVFFDYLPPTSRLVLIEPAAINRRIRIIHERIEANYAEAQARRLVVAAENLFVTLEEFEQRTQALLLTRLAQLPDPYQTTGDAIRVNTGDHSLLAQEIELERKKRGLLAPLLERLETWRQKKEAIILACRSARQVGYLRELLTGHQYTLASLAPPFDKGALTDLSLIYCLIHPLSRGFDLPAEGLHFLSASELFGDKKLLNRAKKSRSAGDNEPIQLEQLTIGDVVVHRDYGIGLFQGLCNKEFGGQQGDFMLISFRDDEKLYVPVEHLHWVSRYQGLTDQEPKLDSLGSQRWSNAKKKVSDAVWAIAQELLNIYAQRAMRQGHAFSVPGQFYQALEDSFPYDETKGQAKAIDDVLGDLMQSQPMDRLICGDVGYGKTEVAARAAFKVIEDGFQVAILAPTTVLAEQHAHTFRERFGSFPLSIACLNRFRSAKEQKEIGAALAAGKIDLIIGTHRLLSKDIEFRKLGLLIIDEEHRFGVSHKEKIKKLKTSVDVLTLSATPIPRTLHMSLLGIRDLSVISTPPQQRKSIKTFLAQQDPLVIREAVLRELERGGQLFFVHNRIQSIHRIAEYITELIPQARVGVAHGQMPGSQLEAIMVRFIRHELDVLVCTTIIESGLDISNANTIVINRADHLGLADIYQLRGRVGRGSRQAYAYLLVPSLDHLTEGAEQRLRALMDCSELGAGFKLAMNDLQLRGGGNLLGISQSGHIAAVGYDLYLELLQSTVMDLKNKVNERSAIPQLQTLEPEIKLKVAAFLPANYIQDTGLRYHTYRRIAALRTHEELDELKEELIDRYGPLPVEGNTLMDMVHLKIALRQLGIYKLEQGIDTLIFSFVDQTPVEPEKILAFVETRNKKRVARLTPDGRLIINLDKTNGLFASIYQVLEDLSISVEKV